MSRAGRHTADRMTRLPGVTAANLGIVDWMVPIRRGGERPVQAAGDETLGVVIAESYNRYRLGSAMAEIETILFDTGLAARVRNAAHYAFSYALDQAGIADLRHHRRDRTG